MRSPVFVVAGAILGLLAGCGSGVPGSGISKTEARTLDGFSAVEFQGQGRIELQQSPTPAFEITADDNLLPLIETRVENNRLVIRNRKPVAPKTTIRIRISAAQLDDLSISGVGDAELSGLKAESLTLTLSGAGSIAAEGEVGDLRATINGTGDMRLDQLAARSATAVISGAGSIDLGRIDELSATVSGAGSIHYLGDPKLTRKSISGVGSISKK